MKTKYIIVKGAAGLGNRLITLTTAITYAKKTNRRLIVDWSEGQFYKKGENAFFQCFDLKGVDYSAGISDIDAIEHLSVYPGEWKKLLYASNFKFRYVPNWRFFNKVIQKLNLKGDIAKVGGFWKVREATTSQPISLKEKISGIFSPDSFPHSSYFKYSRPEDVVVYLDFQPAKFKTEDFINHIALQPHVKSIIDEYAAKLNLSTNAVGIHVRYTDKMPTKSISTIIDKVKRLGLKDPQIFLATDNAEVYDALKKDFPKLFSFSENVPKPPSATKGIHHHFNDDTSYEMFKQSVVDMWLLSKCQYLFWQGNSSFSLISKYLHNDKRKVFDWMAD